MGSSKINVLYAIGEINRKEIQRSKKVNKLLMKFLKIILLTLLISANTFAQKVNIKTSLGDFVVQLESEKAPITSANFLKYVKGGHYKGGSFFRTVRSDNQPDNPIKITVIQAGVHPWKENYLFVPIPLKEQTKLE